MKFKLFFLLLFFPLISFGAIATDSFTGSAMTTATSRTVAHTVSGSDRVLFVDLETDADNITGCTWDTTQSMTLVGKSVGSGGNAGYSYFLIAPNTGTHNAVCSASVNTDFRMTVSSYTGVNQSMTYSGGSPTDAYSTTVIPASTTDSSCSITTIQDNSWVRGTQQYQRDTTLSGLSTFRAYGDTGSNRAPSYDSNSAQSPAGSMTLGASITSAGASLPRVCMSFSPSTGGGGSPPSTPSTTTPNSIATSSIYLMELKMGSEIMLLFLFSFFVIFKLIN